MGLSHAPAKLSLLETHFSGHCVIHSIKRKTEQRQNISDSRVFFAKFPEGEDLPWISFAPSSVSGEVLRTVNAP